jgi:thiosulfate dehydrogenase [quinone] large subunit
MRSTDAQLAYLGLRLIVGLNFLMHGLVRILGDYSGFAEGLATGFSDTILPVGLVTLTGYLIPAAEAVLGLLLLIGLRLRYTLLATLALMAALIFGMSLRQEWSTVGTQMLYVLILYVLLWRRPDDILSVDSARMPVQNT